MYASSVTTPLAYVIGDRQAARVVGDVVDDPWDRAHPAVRRQLALDPATVGVDRRDLAPERVVLVAHALRALGAVEGVLLAHDASGDVVGEVLPAARIRDRGEASERPALEVVVRELLDDRAVERQAREPALCVDLGAQVVATRVDAAHDHAPRVVEHALQPGLAVVDGEAAAASVVRAHAQPARVVIDADEVAHRVDVEARRGGLAVAELLDDAHAVAEHVDLFVARCVRRPASYSTTSNGRCSARDTAPLKSRVLIRRPRAS